jgi:hypothetical protein
MIDELLSDFYKSRMPRPWPAAPAPVMASPAGNDASRRAGNRARFTLAASVALLVGLCWYFTNGSQPGPQGPTPQPGAGYLNEGSATMPPEFKKRTAPEPPKKSPMLN